MNQKGIGDRVIITRQKSVKHRQIGGLPITGTVIALDPEREHNRVLRIKFDSEYDWDVWNYRLDECKRIYVWAIMGCYEGATEELDSFTSYREARDMRKEYRLSFGSDWRVWVRRRKAVEGD